MALSQFSFLLLLYVGVLEALVYDNVTILAGQTLILKCPVKISSNNLDWKNPHNFLLFFNRKKCLKDSRYKLLSLSDSEYTISLSNVSFQDGGFYKCSEYTHPVSEKVFKVTVVGRPRLEKTKHEGKTVIKCSAEANFRPPKISWLFENGLEVLAQPQQHCEANKCSSLDMLLVRSYKKRTVLKCIVRHKAWQNPLMNFIAISDDSVERPLLTSTPGTPFRTRISTAQLPETTSGRQFTTEYEASTFAAAESASTNISISNNNNSIEGNQTGPGRMVDKDRAPLLIFLVTCLIFGLFVVIIFFAIKIRKAHVLWKKENEDTDQSLESNKSKSSHEDKQSQERRGHASIKQGFNSTYFTKYANEESVAKDEPKNKENTQTTHTTHVQVNVETHEQGADSQIKETEL